MDTIQIDNLEEDRLFIKRKTIEQLELEELYEIRIRNLQILLDKKLITQEDYDKTRTKLDEWKVK